MSRLGIALMIFVALALRAWQTLADEKIRLVTLAILAMFAVRTVAASKTRDSQRDLRD